MHDNPWIPWTFVATWCPGRGGAFRIPSLISITMKAPWEPHGCCPTTPVQLHNVSINILPHRRSNHFAVSHTTSKCTVTSHTMLQHTSRQAAAYCTNLTIYSWRRLRQLKRRDKQIVFSLLERIYYIYIYIYIYLSH